MDILTPDSVGDTNINDLINIVRNIDIFNVLDRNSYELINSLKSVKIPDNVELIGFLKLQSVNLYVWHETEHHILLFGFQNSPLKSWYKAKRESEVRILINYFENKNKVYYNIHRFYLNTLYDFMTVMNYMKSSFFSSGIIFIDEKDEMTKSAISGNNKFTDLDYANAFSLLIKTEVNEFYVYTKFSNSKIKFENHNGSIIVGINYNQLKLRNRFDPFDKFLPSDVSILLNSFEIKSIHDILDKEELANSDIDICILLAKDKRDLDKLKNKLDVIKKKHNEVADYIDNVMLQIKCDEIFLQIENDGIFRSFENSVDILIKTIYERMSDAKCTDYNHINEILKRRVSNTFLSKFL